MKLIGRPSRAAFFPIGLAALFTIAGCGGEPNTTDPTGGSGASGGGGAGGEGATGGGGSGGAGGEGAGPPQCVVDGELGEGEQCDDGNDVIGDGCENDCSFTCVKGTVKGDAKCDDTDPCNGAETCSDEHLCVPGTAAPDGDPCGAGKICKSGVCGDDVCGDAFTSAAEQCDDGNLTSGDGCEPDCSFTCTSGDPNACLGDPCDGTSTCDDATHTCTPSIPLADGTPCGSGSFCFGGDCKSASCGDAFLDPGEQCDDGNAVNGDGCDIACVYSCSIPALDCPAPAPCNAASCTVDHLCQTQPDPTQDGAACGVNLVCNNGACVVPSAVCGNGNVETGEDCDFGGLNGPGTGCESNCTFSCANAAACNDNNPCNGTESCNPVLVNGQMGQSCFPGAPQSACSVCPGGFCVAGVCAGSMCGDGCLDAVGGEQCEPPGSPTCNMFCQTIVNPVCGNSIREGTEQCDDGNFTNLDGCDLNCKFEQDQRVNYLKMQFATDAYCTANALGAAIVGTLTQGQLQTGLDNGVSDGSITIPFKMMGLDDLSGTNDPTVGVGSLNGTPVLAAGYDGTNDIDWWYTTDPGSIDVNRNPLNVIDGSIVAKVLNAGPGGLDLNLFLGGSVAKLELSDVKLQGTIGATSIPLVSGGFTPGHLLAENLDPELESFIAIGQKTTNGAAKLCGNVSAASLALVPIPAQLVGSGFTACSQAYAATNSLLDVIVGGCTILFTPQIAPTQPDKADLSVTQPGAGGPYVLQANAQKVVTTCRDKNNVIVPLQTCLNAAAYSSFFKIATDRVIMK